MSDQAIEKILGNSSAPLLLVLAICAGCAHTAGASSARDRDADGIVDAEDRCPDQAEDRDGFSDRDGCPDLDDDRDGVPDERDRCPRQPEDHDRFKDGDGCPDPDNDNDRIPDTTDACPDRAESYNGFEDSDGCPDPQPLDPGQPSFTDNLFVVRPIFFAPGADKVRPADARHLAAFARWLASEPAVELLAVIGHASTAEPDPTQLGLRRARAVTKLLAPVVGAQRLRAYSAGTTPAAEWAKVARPRWKDRSVHFRYFRVSGKALYRWNGLIDVPVAAKTNPPGRRHPAAGPRSALVRPSCR